MTDLDNVSNCPMGAVCENCGSDEELNIETVSLGLQGISCLTLCDVCTEFGRTPTFSVFSATDRVLEHCSHLGITADEMDSICQEDR